MVLPTDLDPSTLIAKLADPTWRAELIATAGAETGSDLPVTNAFWLAARHAAGTPEELQVAVEALLADDADDLAADLVLHDLPEAFLLRLCDEDRCTSALGHRRHPRSLLERMVEVHAFDEAILSLGLDDYRDPTVPPEAFAAFLARHADHDWLLRTLAEVTPSHPEKERAYEALLDGHEQAATFHARHVASRTAPPDDDRP